jgi:hypothetical protein
MKRLVGLVLVGFGVIFFVIFISSLNAAERDGAPIGIGGPIETIIIVILGLVFLGVAVGGMKLADLRQRTGGLIALAAGAAIAIIGIWHHFDGPSLDKVGPVSDDRIPVSPELNIVVYVVAGLYLTAGLLLTMLGKTKKVS